MVHSATVWLVSCMIACTYMECHVHPSLFFSLSHPFCLWLFFSASLLYWPHTLFILLCRWLYGKTVCSIYAFCGVLFGICSLTSLTLLSMVCFVKVCYPLYGKSSKKLFWPLWNDTCISHYIPKWLIVDLSEEENEMIIPHEALHISLPLTSLAAGLNKNYLWCGLMRCKSFISPLEKCFPRQCQRKASI